MDHVDSIIAQWAQERPDLNTGPMAVIGRIKRLSDYLSREMEKTHARHGLSFASFDVLATLRRSGTPYSLSPGALLEATMVTSGTMTNRIDQLAKAGLVERTKNPDDGRGFLVTLTPKGYKVIDDAVTDHVETQQRLMAPLGAEDKRLLDRILGSYLSEIETA